MLENQGEDRNALTTELYRSQSPVSARGHSTPLSRADYLRTPVTSHVGYPLLRASQVARSVHV